MERVGNEILGRKDEAANGEQINPRKKKKSRGTHYWALRIGSLTRKTQAEV